MPAPVHNKKLQVTYRMWCSTGEPPYTATHKGQTVSFTQLVEARNFAKQNNYEGIQVTSK